MAGRRPTEYRLRLITAVCRLRVFVIAPPSLSFASATVYSSVSVNWKTADTKISMF